MIESIKNELYKSLHNFSNRLISIHSGSELRVYLWAAICLNI